MSEQVYYRDCSAVYPGHSTICYKTNIGYNGISQQLVDRLPAGRYLCYLGSTLLPYSAHIWLFLCGTQTVPYYSIILEESTCELCQSNEIEDEIHFICRCNFLNVKHTALFNSISETIDEFYQFSDSENFIFLMKYIQRQLSKFTREKYFLNVIYN